MIRGSVYHHARQWEQWLEQHEVCEVVTFRLVILVCYHIILLKKDCLEKVSCNEERGEGEKRRRGDGEKGRRGEGEKGDGRRGEG